MSGQDLVNIRDLIREARSCLYGIQPNGPRERLDHVLYQMSASVAALERAAAGPPLGPGMMTTVTGPAPEHRTGQPGIAVATRSGRRAVVEVRGPRIAYRGR